MWLIWSLIIGFLTFWPGELSENTYSVLSGPRYERVKHSNTHTYTCNICHICLSYIQKWKRWGRWLWTSQQWISQTSWQLAAETPLGPAPRVSLSVNLKKKKSFHIGAHRPMYTPIPLYLWLADILRYNQKTDISVRLYDFLFIDFDYLLGLNTFTIKTIGLLFF